MITVVNDFLYELWVTATAAATADDQTLTHTLLHVKHCLQPPKPKPLTTPGLSSPQLQRKGTCFSGDTFLLLSRCEREDFSTELKMYFMLGMESGGPVRDKMYIYKLYLARRWGFIRWDCFVLFFCFYTLFPFGLFGCWVECRRLFGSWERSGPRDVSVYIVYRCICRTSMFKSYLFTERSWCWLWKISGEYILKICSIFLVFVMKAVDQHWILCFCFVFVFLISAILLFQSKAGQNHYHSRGSGGGTSYYTVQPTGTLQSWNHRLQLSFTPHDDYLYSRYCWPPVSLCNSGLLSVLYHLLYLFFQAAVFYNNNK